MGIPPALRINSEATMTPTTKLPDDIEAAIKQIYRNGDHDFVRSRQVPSAKWHSLVESVSNQYVVRDQTDFNYGLAHVFTIYLTSDVRAGVGSVEIQRKLLDDIRELKFVRVSISVILPYFMVSFGRYRVAVGSPEHAFALKPQSEDQAQLAALVETTMKNEGLRRLDPEMAELIVPDVQTELRGIGTATVSDLIIGPY